MYTDIHIYIYVHVYTRICVNFCFVDSFMWPHCLLVVVPPPQDGLRKTAQWTASSSHSADANRVGRLLQGRKLLSCPLVWSPQSGLDRVLLLLGTIYGFYRRSHTRLSRRDEVMGDLVGGKLIWRHGVFTDLSLSLSLCMAVKDFTGLMEGLPQASAHRWCVAEGFFVV